MPNQSESGHDISLQVKNIGGIDETSMQIRSGVTALVGENATNRTSLIQAIAAGLGSDSYTLKSDATQGEVLLTVGEDTYTRTIERTNSHIETDGNPYLGNPTLADLYGVLLESNDIRRAVRNGDDLRDLILEPVDTDRIEQEIGECVDRRREIDSELDRLDTLADELTGQKATRRRKRDELAELTENLEAKRSDLETLEQNNDREESPSEAELDQKLSELQTVRTELEQVTETLERERESLRRLEDNRDTIQSQYESQSPPDDAEIARLEERIEGLRTRKRSLDSTISELQQVIRFNNKRLDDIESTLTAELDDDADDGSVVDQLNPKASTVTCWTCGTDVERSSIEGMVDQLQELRQEKTQEKTRITNDLTELTQELDSLSSRQDEWAKLESQLDSIAEKIETRKTNIESLETQREELKTRAETLEADVENLQQEQQDELLQLQQIVSELEFEKQQLESEIEQLTDNIESIEDELATRDELEAKRQELSEELQELRTRIDRIEQHAIEAFNTHMNALIEKLGYDNIERIWLEQTETEVRNGRHKTTEKQFELHIVRGTGDGDVYEDTVTHLSESEREIIGLVVALAGYLVHDVYEQVPFMLLDSIEMIDGNRLFDLISYLEEYVPYLIVVLLPDHAQTFRERTSEENYQIMNV